MMKKKVKVLAAFCGLVLGAGAVGLFYVPEVLGGDVGKTKVYTDEGAASYCGFKIEGAFDTVTTSRIKEPLLDKNQTQIGSAVIEIAVVRKQMQNGIYSDTVLTRTSLSTTADNAYIMAYGMTIEPEDKENVTLTNHCPINQGGTTNLTPQVGAEFGTDGPALTFSVGTELEFASLEYNDMTDKYAEKYGVSYSFDRPILKIDTNSRNKEAHCKNSVLLGFASYESELAEYDLDLTAGMLFEKQSFLDTHLYADALNYQIHVGSTDCLLTEQWLGAIDPFIEAMQFSDMTAETTTTTTTTTVTTTATAKKKPETTAPKTQPTEPETVPVTQESITVPSTTVQTSAATRPTTAAVPETQPAPVTEATREVTTAAAAAEAINRAADLISSAPVFTEPFSCNVDYYIVPCSNTNVCLTAAGKAEKSKITVENIAGSALQKWHLEEKKGGYYIVNTATNKVVDMKVNSVSELRDFKGVWLRDKFSDDPEFDKTQTFTVTPLGDGTFKFVVAYNPTYTLDIYGDTTHAGAAGQLYHQLGSFGTQVFLLIEA